MYQLFMDWMGDVSFLDQDLVFLFVFLASLFILNFLLDFFRYIMYHILKR